MSKKKHFTDGDVSIPVEEFITKNYAKFKILHGNRKVYPIHVNRMCIAFKEKKIELPIIVNEKGEVADGQTRLEACRRLGITVRYRVVPGLTLEDVQILNSNTRPWKTEDYLDSYCVLGREEYKICRKFWSEFPSLKIGSVIAMLSGRVTAHTESFRRGMFSITSLEWARKFAEFVYSLEEFYDGFNIRNFVQALLVATAKEDFQWDVFRSRLEMIPPRLYLKDAANMKDYLRMIEDIYNYKRPQAVRLF